MKREFFRSKRGQRSTEIDPAPKERVERVPSTPGSDPIEAELIQKLGFGFLELKNKEVEPRKLSIDPAPPLDHDVELWLDKLIAETKIKSNLFISSHVEEIDFSLEKRSQKTSPSRKKKVNEVEIEKVTRKKVERVLKKRDESAD